MVQPKKKPGKPESSPEVLAITKKGEVFQAHEKGVILKLSLSFSMCERLKKALEMESSLSQYGLKNVGANGLFANFIFHSLQRYENDFATRKTKLELKAKNLPLPRLLMIKGKQHKIETLKTWILQVEKVQAALEAGDPGPQKALSNESLVKHRAVVYFYDRAMGRSLKWIPRIEGVLTALDAGDSGPAKALSEESLRKNRELLKDLEMEVVAHTQITEGQGNKVEAAQKITK